METSDEETRPPLAHYSTGRLTTAQAVTMAAWRDRLREDAPLPGIQPKPEALRRLGLDDRPAASCSDVIAAAVADLLDLAPPAELDLARYAHRATEAQKHAGQGHPSTHAPVHQPVSFYLPPPLATRYEQLRRAALDHVHELLHSLREQAHDRYPGTGRQLDRTLWVTDHLAHLGLPATPARPLRITGRVFVIPVVAAKETACVFRTGDSAMSMKRPRVASGCAWAIAMPTPNA